MSAQKPVHFIAKKNGKKYYAVVETFINSVLGFGSVKSDIPEQPINMRELIDLRQKGYLILNNTGAKNV